jgi:aminoglycoside 3-N-acetyltransferase
MATTRELEALVPILESMGVPRNGVLVVHSAIALLSRRGFRAEAMIETFLDYMREGTLVMPTMTWRAVTPQSPNWDELETRSETGVLTEIFRARYAARRSIHPTHSVAAWGAAADALVAQHHLGDTPVSGNSPYGLMRSHKSYVMMIGVGLETCTAIHLPEETIAPDVYLRPLNPSEIYHCKDRHGRVHRMHTRRHWSLDRDFPQFGPTLAAKDRMRAGSIEGCGYMIVGLQDLLEVVTEALLIDKNGTLNQSRCVS